MRYQAEEMYMILGGKQKEKSGVMFAGKFEVSIVISLAGLAYADEPRNKRFAADELPPLSVWSN